MRLSLDGTSVAVGLFCGAALVAAFGATQPDGRSGVRDGSPPAVRSGDAGIGANEQGPPRETPLVGRFQVAAGGGQSGPTAYVVDTATGRVWEEPDAPRGSDRYAAFLAPKLDAAE